MFKRDSKRRYGEFEERSDEAISMTIVRDCFAFPVGMDSQ